MLHLTPFAVQAEWGLLKLARPLRPGKDGWGPFAVLKRTPWRRAFSVVSQDVLDHAVRGYTDPLEKGLKISPEDFHKLLSDAESLCVQHQSGVCPLRDSKCIPCSDMPACYEPPLVDRVALDVALAIRDGRYPLIVR